MKDLVQIQESKVTTTSLKVAEVFGKEHRHVLRDIKALVDEIEQLENGGQSKFGLSSYLSKQGKELPMYIMDKNAFTLLVMGY